MKKALSLLLAIVMMIGMLPMAVFATTSPTIWLETDFTTELEVGDTFTVTAMLKDNVRFDGMTLTLKWNENAVKFTGFKMNGRLVASEVCNAALGYSAASVNHTTGKFAAVDTSGLGYDTNGMIFVGNFEIVGEGALDIGLKMDDPTVFEMVDNTGTSCNPVADTSVFSGLTVGGKPVGPEMPEDAPFTAITTDAGAIVAIEQWDDLDVDPWGTGMGTPVVHYHITVSEDTTEAYVRFPLSVDNFVPQDFMIGENEIGSAYASVNHDDLDADAESGMAGLQYGENGDDYTVMIIPMEFAAGDMMGNVGTLPAIKGEDELYYAVGPQDNGGNTYALFSFEYAGEEEEIYSITIDENMVGGTLTVVNENGEPITEAAAGDYVFVTITPADGYRCNSYTINGVIANDVIFQMPEEDVVLSATFTHTCEFKEVVADEYLKEAATCQHGKLYYKSCSCGAFGTETFEVGEPVDHSYVNDVCEWCNAERPHVCVYDQEVVADEYLKEAATCQAQAVYYKSCTCELFDNSENAETFSAGALGGHNYVNGECTGCHAKGYAFATSADVTAMKEGTATVDVMVTGHSNEAVENYNAYDVTVSYDPTKLEYVSIVKADGNASVTVDAENGTIRIVGCGSDKPFATAIATLTFKTLGEGDADVTVTSIKVSDKNEAIKDNAPDATADTEEETPDVSVIKVPFSVVKDDFVDGNETVLNGDDYVFSFAEPDHYTYDDLVVKVGGEVVEPEYNAETGEYTIPNVTGNVEITVNQTANVYNVTFDESNTAVVDGEPTATYGEDYIFTVTPSENHGIDSVTVTDANGNEVPHIIENGEYVIAGTAITADFTITVTEVADQTTVKFSGVSEEEVKDGLEQSANVGQEFTFQLNKEDGYDYIVKVGETELEENEDGTYTIPAELMVKEEVQVVITKEDNTKPVVDVTEYITLNETSMFLVTAKWKDKVLAYGEEGTMFWSDKYTVTGEEEAGAYCWLVVSTGEMDTIDEVKAAAEAAIAEAAEGVTATAIAYDCDVNGTDVVDVNDAQLAYDMYNASYMEFTENLPMWKFLEADMYTDGKLDTQDVAAIINYIVSGANA